MKGDAVDKRLDKTRRIMKTIALRPRPFSLLHLEDGTSPLVVALPGEYASEVVDRVRRTGGKANVAIAYAKSFEILTFEDNAPSNTELLINHDLSMGMLAIKLKENPGVTVRLRFRDTDAEVPSFESEMAYV